MTLETQLQIYGMGKLFQKLGTQFLNALEQNDSDCAKQLQDVASDLEKMVEVIDRIVDEISPDEENG